MDKSATTKRRTRAIDAILATRSEGRTIANRSAWAQTVGADIEHQHGPKLDQMLHDFPDAPPDVIAGALETGDARTLAYYAPTDPTPDEPDRRLTPDERAAVLANAKEAK